MDNETTKSDDEYHASEQDHEIFQSDTQPERKLSGGNRKRIFVVLGIFLLIFCLYKLYGLFSATPHVKTDATVNNSDVSTITPAVIAPGGNNGNNAGGQPAAVTSATTPPPTPAPATTPASVITPAIPAAIAPPAQATAPSQSNTSNAQSTINPAVNKATSGATTATTKTSSTTTTTSTQTPAITSTVSSTPTSTISSGSTSTSNPASTTSNTSTPNSTSTTPVSTGPAVADSEQNDRIDSLEQSETENHNAIQNMQNQVNALTTTISGFQASITTLNSTLNNLKTQAMQVQAPPIKPAIIIAKKVVANSNIPAPRPRYYRGSATPGAQYYVKAMIQGRAWLVDTQGATVTISSGDSLPGYGLIEQIDPSQGIVTTSSGAIIQYNPSDR